MTKKELEILFHSYEKKISSRKLRLWVSAMFDISEYNYPETKDIIAYREGESYKDEGPYDLPDMIKCWLYGKYDKEGDPSIEMRAELLQCIVGNQSVELPKCTRCNGDGKRHGADRPFEGPDYPGKCFICHGYGHIYTNTDIIQLTKAVEEQCKQRCKRSCKQIGERRIYCIWENNGPYDSAWVQCESCKGTGYINGPLFDNQRLLVLSDALEEAGCTEESILEHLRYLGNHVKGCWVIDLILGKN